MQNSLEERVRHTSLFLGELRAFKPDLKVLWNCSDSFIYSTAFGLKTTDDLEQACFLLPEYLVVFLYILLESFHKDESSTRLLPSRSSMDFSSLATVLSANSARVSAWQESKQSVSQGEKRALMQWVQHAETSCCILKVCTQYAHIYSDHQRDEYVSFVNISNIISSVISPPSVCRSALWSPPRTCLLFLSTGDGQTEKWHYWRGNTGIQIHAQTSCLH